MKSFHRNEHLPDIQILQNCPLPTVCWAAARPAWSEQLQSPHDSCHHDHLVLRPVGLDEDDDGGFPKVVKVL